MSNLRELFHARLRGEGAGHADIIEHLPLLHYLATQCTHITEFGVRTGNSTVAFLAGLAASPTTGLRAEGAFLSNFKSDEDAARFYAAHTGVLQSYDINPPSIHIVAGSAEWAQWHFTQADTGQLPDIAPTDLLFIDTLHTAAQVEAELRHAARVGRFLVFHDTVLFGEHGEIGQPGIMPAIEAFRRAHPEWREFCHMRNCNGLLVLERT